MSAQLDELGGISGLIVDAASDTTLWLQAAHSAEEEAHVRAMQGRLLGLDRIITRRMERRGSPEDDRQWSETVAEVLSLLEKAREVRGNIVGKGLARLADHLPKGLPGSKVPLVTQAAAPPTQAGGRGIAPAAPKPYRVPAPVRPVSTALTSFTLSSREPKPMQIPQGFPAYFPNELKARTAVILAEAVRKFPDRKQMPELCEYVISEMTPIFCEAVQRGTLRADLALSESGGMGDLLHWLLVHNDDGPKSSGFSSLSDQAYRIEQEARKSEEWLYLARAIADAEGKRKTSAETLYGPVLTGVGPSKPKIGLNLERSLFATRDSWISRAAPKRDNRGSRPRGDKPSEGFSHSPDYRSVTIRGKAHTLTARQAQIIEILHKAHVDGNPDVSTAHILETLETERSRWQDTFRTNPKAKSALIKGGARRGTLRLNL